MAIPEISRFQYGSSMAGSSMAPNLNSSAKTSGPQQVNIHKVQFILKDLLFSEFAEFQVKSENAVSSANRSLLLLFVLCFNVCGATQEQKIGFLKSPHEEYFTAKLLQGVNEQLPQGATLKVVTAETADDSCQILVDKDRLQDWNGELHSLPCSCAGKGFKIVLTYLDKERATGTRTIENQDPNNIRETVCKKEDQPNEEQNSYELVSIIIVIGILIVILSFAVVAFHVFNQTQPDQPDPEAGEIQMEDMNEAGGPSGG